MILMFRIILCVVASIIAVVAFVLIGVLTGECARIDKKFGGKDGVLGAIWYWI